MHWTRTYLLFAGLLLLVLLPRPASLTVRTVVGDDGDGEVTSPRFPGGSEIIRSDPADRFVDPRQDRDAEGGLVGITRVEVTFSAPVVLDRSCVEIMSTGSLSPAVTMVEGAGMDWTIHLDRPIPPGSTAVVFGGGVSSLIFHAYPGDVNLDGTTDANDLLSLQQVLDTGESSLSQHDVNRDGVVDAADLEGLGLLVERYNGTTWSDAQPRRVFCCCHEGVCSIHLGFVGCVDGDAEVACPCMPNPCTRPPIEIE
jgi:hypothetical protein